MISEDWSNDAENIDLNHKNKLQFNTFTENIVIRNCNNFYSFLIK